MTKLKSIAKEEAACRAAHAKYPRAKLFWCCHHEILIEPRTESAETRIHYICNYKEGREKARRLRSFRPVKDTRKARALFEKFKKAQAHARLVRSHDFNVAREDYHIHASYDKYAKACREADRKQAAALMEARAPLEALHDKEWPGHTWKKGTVLS